jgi:hypothetical protein
VYLLYIGTLIVSGCTKISSSNIIKIQPSLDSLFNSNTTSCKIYQNLSFVNKLNCCKDKTFVCADDTSKAIDATEMLNSFSKKLKKEISCLNLSGQASCGHNRYRKATIYFAEDMLTFVCYIPCDTLSSIDVYPNLAGHEVICNNWYIFYDNYD